MSGYSGIILAGGAGTRLSALTRTLSGDERPKQFCRLIGEETLLGGSSSRHEVSRGQASQPAGPQPRGGLQRALPLRSAAVVFLRRLAVSPTGDG
jgi:hypothetical protein